MDRKPNYSVVGSIVCGVACAVSIESSFSQPSEGAVPLEAYRVNAFQKFIVANTYLFDDSARLSYLYAYNPATLEEAAIAPPEELSVLKPSGDEVAWWAEAPYHVIGLDSYPECAKSENKLSCIQNGAFLATSEKLPEIQYDYLFVIKGRSVEVLSDANDMGFESVAD